MADRLAENGALQYATTSTAAAGTVSRLAGAGQIEADLLSYLRDGFYTSKVSALTVRGRIINALIDAGFLPGKTYNFTFGTLDSSITFSRSSNATIVNSAGNIAYAPHNLLTNSESFEASSWTKSNTTISSNAIAAPDGTLTADKLVETTAASSVHGITQAITTTANSYVISVYAKAAERTWVLVGNSNVANARAWFDLSTGAKGTLGAGAISSSIDSVGNGWYRCSVTLTATAASNTFYIYSSTADGAATYTGDGVSGIYLWGAQLEIGSTATTYNPTTPKNLLGFTEEFDNAAWTKSNSFVQTNLLKYSEDFSNASWSGFAAITANTEIAPNGYQTADTLTANAVYQPVTCTASTQYTFSFYAKLGTMLANKYLFAVRDDTAGVFIAQDISPSVTLTTSEWQRVTYTFTTPVGCTIVRPYIYRDSAGGANGTAYIWGAQLVQGSTAGDYIRTDATAQAVRYSSPDGYLNADKLVEDTATSIHIVRTASLTLNVPVTFSCYMKAAERSIGYLQLSGSGSIAYFNLSTGVVGTTTDCTATMQSIGNGWYRCAITDLTTTNAFAIIGITTSDNTLSYAGNGTSGIYIYGAQLSNSASLDPYVYNPAAALTSVAYYAPRFTYDPVTLEPQGLLIEEARTNLLLQSENFGTTWTTTDATVSLNQVTAPDGNLTADKFIASANTNLHFLRQDFVGVDNTTYTASIYAKAGEFNSISLEYVTQDGLTKGIGVNLSTGIIGAGRSGTSAPTSSSAVNVGNGWWRISITNSINTGATLERVNLFVGNNGVFNSILGDGTSGIYIWGAQLEAGAFATSYIPTGASSVTRAADVAVVQGNNFFNWYNPNEGTIYTSFVGGVSNAHVYNLGTGVSNRVVNLFLTSIAYALYKTSDAQQITFGTRQTNSKVSCAYQENNYGAVANGGSVSTDASTSGLATTTSFIIGGLSTSSGYLNGTIKQISYYPTRLQNSQLVALSS